MKVLHIGAKYGLSGAGLGLSALHKELLDLGINSQVLVQKSMDVSTEIHVEGNRGGILSGLKRKMEATIVKGVKKKEAYIFSLGLVGSTFKEKVDMINPDIIHIHWPNAFTLSIDEISKINRPIVWTLRDCWAFTGGCHYFGK